MNYLPENLQKRIDVRKANNALRTLGNISGLVDFSSNDYLGFSKHNGIFNTTHHYLLEHNFIENGSTGSRLLSGNHPLYKLLEPVLCEFHNSESSLIFNSGYDANLGFFSSVPQRGDIILYDELVHASIRDGIQISNAQAYKYKHNNLTHLENSLNRFKHKIKTIYVVTESVFSMDGDSPNLIALTKLCNKYNAYLIVDEAHAVGVFGEHGEGLVQHLKLESSVFARIITFGKAIGCHGAAILGNPLLKQYLINFARSFIYTTALSPHNLASIKMAYKELLNTSNTKAKNILNENIEFFKAEIKRLHIKNTFIKSHSAIHCCIISGNNTVKTISKKLQEQSFNVKPILSPTVLKNKERLRFCLHSYNSKEEITKVLELLATFV